MSKEKERVQDGTFWYNEFMFEGPNNLRRSFPGAEGEEDLRRFPETKESSSDNRLEYNELFAEAQRNLISRKNFNLFVRAVTEKETFGSNDTLSFLHNRIVEECVNLSEHDTELILDQFNRSVQKWFVEEYSRGKEIDQRVRDSITLGKYTHGEKNIDIRGVQSVISFLRARTLLLSSHPAQEHSFYWASRLDGRYSIDVVEEIDGEDGPSITLVQIKSSKPEEEELEKIHSNHQRWAEKEWINVDEYENSFIDEPTKEGLEEFLKNKEKVEEALLDFLTDPRGQSLDNLETALNLFDLVDKERAWVLWKYIDSIKDSLEEVVSIGDMDQETKDEVWSQLSLLRDKLVKKFHLPVSQTVVKNIKSVVCVGARSISERDIEVGEKGKVVNNK